MPVDVRTVLAKTTFRTIDVDELLDPDRPTWVKFDSELGYVPSDIVMKDGIDESRSTYRHEPAGQRKMVNYPDRPCRINTYGDSFTQCQQVSDGETWQEYLAAHLGEPIRNFGSGGYSVNTAYRRARRMEATDSSAEYIILSIFGDDHVRNLDAARWIRTAWSSQFNPNSTTPLHGLPWAHVRFDLDEGRFVDRPGLCRDDAALRDLCDPEHFYETFKDDVIVRLFTLMIGGEAEVADLEALAEALGIHVDLRDPDKRKDDARRLHSGYGLKSTEYILDNMRAWIEGAGKKLMVHLSYGEGFLRDILAGGERFDRCFMDYLERNEIVYVDAGQKHMDDYNRQDLPIEDYANPFFVHPKVAAVFGHYSPAGNHFYAFSVKDEVVDWLDPKPPAYRE